VVQIPGQGEPEAQSEGGEAEAGECGSERWAVQLGYDAAARSVATARRQPSTIDTLRALSPPAHVKTSPRAPPTETTVFRLDCVRLRWYMREADGDYHMVLTDEHGDSTRSANRVCQRWRGGNPRSPNTPQPTPSDPIYDVAVRP
jgi:hypothetical protein